MPDLNRPSVLSCACFYICRQNNLTTKSSSCSSPLPLVTIAPLSCTLFFWSQSIVLKLRYFTSRYIYFQSTSLNVYSQSTFLYVYFQSTCLYVHSVHSLSCLPAACRIVSVDFRPSLRSTARRLRRDHVCPSVVRDPVCLSATQACNRPLRSSFAVI